MHRTLSACYLCNKVILLNTKHYPKMEPESYFCEVEFCLNVVHAQTSCHLVIIQTIPGFKESNTWLYKLTGGMRSADPGTLDLLIDCDHLVGPKWLIQGSADDILMVGKEERL